MENKYTGKSRWGAMMCCVVCKQRVFFKKQILEKFIESVVRHVCPNCGNKGDYVVIKWASFQRYNKSYVQQLKAKGVI